MEPTIIKPLVGSPSSRMTQYRNRAEELRVIAEGMVIPSERETLHRIATTYDEMADTLDTLDKS